MTEPINYHLYKDGEEHIITITPVIPNIPGGSLDIKGVFRLNDDETDMGDIVFDDNMNQWEYTGMGDLTHEQAGEIAGYIQATNKETPHSGDVL